MVTNWTSYCFNDPVDHLHTCCNFLFRISENETVEIFFCIVSVLVRTSFAFLYASFATDTDFGTAFPLHLLQTVTTRTDKKTKEIDFREFLDRNVNFFRWTLRTLLLVVFDRRAEVGIILHSAIDKADPLVFKLLTIADLAGVSTATMTIICGWR